jgi:aspartate 1-decarboxylase
MRLEMLKAKLHQGVVTGADLNYEGSVSIDPALYHEAGILEYEKVDVLNITNGSRLTTYVIEGKPGEICLNGAAARYAQKGDRVIIVAYASFEEEEAKEHKPKVLILDEDNAIKRII